MAKAAQKADLKQHQVQAEPGTMLVTEVRLPMPQAFRERYDVDASQWKVLCEAIYPSAKTPESIGMALAYCKARNLDPFKRPVHIVPMYSAQLKRMIETVWPGIAELRTTASRTKQYAGCDETIFGPDIEEEFEGEIDEYDRGEKSGSKVIKRAVRYPEWAQITVWRLVDGVRCPFVGPKTYWIETYAKQGRTEVPNEMWSKRPRGQLEKCAEAAALRKAFPEELGNQLTAEEMEGQRIIDSAPIQPVRRMPPADLTAGAPKQIEARQDSSAEYDPDREAEYAERARGKREEPAEEERAKPADDKPAVAEADAWVDKLCAEMEQAADLETLEAIKVRIKDWYDNHASIPHAERVAGVLKSRRAALKKEENDASEG